MRLRRFEEQEKTGNPWTLGDDHPAVREGRTRYPLTVRSPESEKRVLKRGMHSKKIGDRVVKGHWAGMPIYTLTLEERATCPTSCHHWADCYGNKMHWSHRFEHGLPLENRLREEVAALIAKHGQIVVRLHVLGDFYSPAYCLLWGELLARHPGLHIFGYTAHRYYTTLGQIIAEMRLSYGRRFAIRFSVALELLRAKVDRLYATTIDDAGQAPAGSIVCPAQTGKTACCGTCGLCWTTDKVIAFLAH